jgi:hypothetical protein
MSGKKVGYMELLKEAISEFDTSKNVDVKGPMLDPIIGYDGGGEIQTHKNVSDILERYYFNQSEDKGVTVEDFDTSDGKVAKEEVDHIDKDAVDDKGKAMPKVAPKSDSDVGKLKDKITGAMKDLTGSTEVNEQDDDMASAKKAEEEAEESGEKAEEGEEGEEEEKKLDVDKEIKSESEELENQVIQKLIDEMEEEVSDEGDVVSEEEVKKDFTKTDSGNVAAGDDETDDRALVPDFKPVPDRKDKAEATGPPAAKLEEDIDAEIEDDIAEALGPGLRSSAHDPEDMGDKEESVEEQFAIFKEAIKDEEEEVTDIDSSEIRV